LGASDVIDYTAGDVVDAVRAGYPDGIDAVADMHGDAEEIAKLSALIGAGGHVASAVGAADVEALATRGIEGTNVNGRVTTARLETLLDLMAAGSLVAPEVSARPLVDAAEALATVGSSHVRGKIVVQVGA
jgi:NADPH:quinone reductase-like Zn-dependent oxidoreductase